MGRSLWAFTRGLSLIHAVQGARVGIDVLSIPPSTIGCPHPELLRMSDIGATTGPCGVNMLCLISKLINIAELQDLLVGFVQNRSIQILRRNATIYRCETVPTAILPDEIISQGKGNYKGNGEADHHRQETRWIRWLLVGEEEMRSDDVSDAVSDKHLGESA